MQNLHVDEWVGVGGRDGGRTWTGFVSRNVTNVEELWSGGGNGRRGSTSRRRRWRRERLETGGSPLLPPALGPITCASQSAQKGY